MPNPTPTRELIVTQTDRDAANSYRDEAITRLMKGDPGGWKDTPEDYLVQAFAAHRVRAEDRYKAALARNIAASSALRRAIEMLAEFVEADLDELAADGGITVGMVYQQWFKNCGLGFLDTARRVLDTGAEQP